MLGAPPRVRIGTGDRCERAGEIVLQASFEQGGGAVCKTKGDP
jgi:hypothetical protein